MVINVAKVSYISTEMMILIFMSNVRIFKWLVANSLKQAQPCTVRTEKKVCRPVRT